MTMPVTENNRSGPVAMKDIAARCNVSVMTVSRALRRMPSISEETTNRILAIAAELGYDPSYHQDARRMVLRQHGKDIINQVVGLFFPRRFYQINYFTNIFLGILDVLTEDDYGLLTTYVHDTPEESLLPIFIRGDVDGAIFHAQREQFTSIYNQLRAEPHFGSRPIVHLFHPTPGCSAVLEDGFGGAYAATAHLLDLGHRHILHFTSYDDDVHSRRQRLAGARQACVDHGIDPDAILRLGKHNTYQKHILEALQQTPRITAIMTGNDPSAIGARDLLREQGLRVPQDISIVGFDDTDPMLDHRGKNMLTTVKVPLIELGQQAANVLLRRIRGEAPEDEDVVLPTNLVVRGSTARPGASRRKALG